MKKIIIIYLSLISIIIADPLTDYISKFDKRLAIDLYESALEANGDDVDILAKLAGLYKDNGKLGLAGDAYRHLLNIGNISEDLYKEYIALLFDIKAYPKIRSTISTFYSDSPWAEEFVVKSYFYEGKFDTSLQMARKLNTPTGQKIYDLSVEGLELKPRSAFLGGAMSAVIPGSGKIYGGRLWDGLQAFTMVAAPAYNAYYHFDKAGVKSWQGWVWTAVASWFYLSDIYGSVKAVQEYNEAQKFKVIKKL